MAGVQREISRLPAGVVRLSDEEERHRARRWPELFRAMGWRRKPAIEKYVTDIGRNMAPAPIEIRL